LLAATFHPPHLFLNFNLARAREVLERDCGCPSSTNRLETDGLFIISKNGTLTLKYERECAMMETLKALKAG